MLDLPAYTWVLVMTGVLGIPTVTCVMLRGGAIAAGLRARSASLVAMLAWATWATWIAASALMANAGVYRPASGPVPWLGVCAGGVFIVILTATRIPLVDQILAAPGMIARLTIPHTFRVVGVVFVIVAALGKLPYVFALPAGLGDVAVGLSAPFVARRLARGDGYRRAMWFNALALLDLTVAVTVGFLAGLGPFSSVTPSTSGLALLPLALILTTVVPLGFGAHLVSLRRLRSSRAARLEHEQAATAEND